MKKITVLFLLLLPLLLFSITREVSLDGTHQYTSIQTAVNASLTGDIVLVHPGRYVENIDINGHSVTIASLYSQNPLQTYIDNTIIDGNLNTCIMIDGGETVTVNGFTMVNNEQHIFQNTFNYGGAFYILNSSHAYIKNCVIRNCIARYGGAIYARLHAILELSNVDINNNQSVSYGGGIMFSSADQLVWDDSNPSRVYNNTAPYGMDIYINSSTQIIDIRLSLGSTALDNPDNFYIAYDDYSLVPTVSIEQGFFTNIDADVYVNPLGLDSNDGLSILTPFKTIKHAMQVINSNPEIPRTIFLAAGVYSYSSNGEIIPLALKPYVNLTGAGAESTIIDGEMHSTFFGAYHAYEMKISDISFINGYIISIVSPVAMQYSHDIKLSNLVFNNNSSDSSSGIYLALCHDVIIENVVAGNTTTFTHDISTMSIHQCDNIYLNNIVSANNTISSRDFDLMGLFFDESDVVLRNTIIANNSAIDAYALYYQCALHPDSTDNLDMSNVLICNNTVTQPSWIFSPVYLQNRYQRMQVNNCTIAGNHSPGLISSIFCYADISNLVSYNPGQGGELYLNNHLYNEYNGQYIDANVTLRNSLFSSAEVGSVSHNLVTAIDNIFNGNPLFEGMVNDSLDVSQPEYYQLSANSPCINTGVADTTGMNLPLMDLAGNHRVWDGRIDMGCYEYGSEPVANDNPEYPALPDKIALSFYPNPVYLNGAKGGYTFIEFTLPELSKEQPLIEIYNLKGQRVRTLKVAESFEGMKRKAGLNKNGELKIENGKLAENGKLKIEKGEFFSTVWDCKDEHRRKLASGIYVVKVTSGEHQATTKVTILK